MQLVSWHLWQIGRAINSRRQAGLGSGASNHHRYRNAASGAANYLETAIAHSGEFQASSPVQCKSAWKASGYNYPGQTELLAQHSGVQRFGMLFVARSPHTGWTLRTLLATTHIPGGGYSYTLLATKLDLLVEQQNFGLETPRIAIAGFKSHSGELGQLGQEEQEWLIPWLQQRALRSPSVAARWSDSTDSMWVGKKAVRFGWRFSCPMLI